MSPYGGSGFRTRGPKIHRRQHERNKKHTMSSISTHDETRRVKTTRAAGKKYLRKIETFSADYDDDQTIQCLPSITQMVNPCLRRQQYLASRVDFMTNFLVILLLFYVHFVSMFFLLSCSLCLLCCFFTERSLQYGIDTGLGVFCLYIFCCWYNPNPRGSAPRLPDIELNIANLSCDACDDMDKYDDARGLSCLF